MRGSARVNTGTYLKKTPRQPMMVRVVVTWHGNGARADSARESLWSSAKRVWQAG